MFSTKIHKLMGNVIISAMQPILPFLEFEKTLRSGAPECEGVARSLRDRKAVPVALQRSS